MNHQCKSSRLNFVNQAVTLGIFASLSLTSVAFAQGAKPAADGAAAPSATERESDRLDLKKLEDKYWAAKDTDFSVVQNRAFPKDDRFYITGSYGPMVNDPYSSSYFANAALGHYFSERWGLEVAHEMVTDPKNTDSLDFYVKRFSVSPDFNRFVRYTSMNLIWVPFYAKVSFIDSMILYFDIQFGFGLGNLTYASVQSRGDQQESTLGYNFDFTQQLFINKYMAIRLDLKNKWSNQNRYRYSGGVGGSNSFISQVTVNDTSFLLGLTLFFP